MYSFNQDHPLFQQNEHCLLDFIKFEQKITALATEMRINLHDYKIDHIGIAVETQEIAEQWLRKFAQCGEIFSQNIINGRMIYLIKLTHALRFAGQWVDVIELPFPKNKRYSKNTWEHIEIVLPFTTNETVKNWILRINQLYQWNKSGKLKVKMSEPKGEGEQIPNPSITVGYANDEQSVRIKVHPYDIQQIVKNDISYC